MTHERSQERLVAQAEVLRAMAHPSRLLIVELLAEREHTVGELTERLGCDMSTASRHLAVLRNVGIIASRKEGQSVIHRLTADCLGKFMECIDRLLSTRARRVQAGLPGRRSR